MNAARASADGKRRARLVREHAAGAHRGVNLTACPSCGEPDPHPTFQELRDGQRYRTADGKIVKVLGPFLPGQAILAVTVEDGAPYHCFTRQLWRIES